MPGELRIVFTNFPGQEDARFVECELRRAGPSTLANGGRPDGFVELVIRDLPRIEAELIAFPRE